MDRDCPNMKSYAFVSNLPTLLDSKLSQRLERIGSYLSNKGYILWTRGDSPAEQMINTAHEHKVNLPKGANHFPYKDSVLDVGCKLYEGIEKMIGLEISNRLRHVALVEGRDFLIYLCDNDQDEDIRACLLSAKAFGVPIYNLSNQQQEIASLLKSIQ